MSRATRGHSRCVVGALLAGALVVGVAACGPGTTTRDGTWYLAEEPDPAASVVPITIEFGACDEYAVDVEESTGQVEITVVLTFHEPGGGEVCPDVLWVRSVEVSLDEPLDDRVVTGPGHREDPLTG